ncbi:tripartite tricarboxylate transporter substrate binding protein [Comamonas testosteroni]|uniref:Bug family tripartite tricarboxylate transporter substrate binding protein n=1 Tax=Comamonas testosteroni TaxID=285 RepID=UPI0026EC301C|nr:tripartite tricarboxylate transporter substrate binding protein [Comamonas testosteroni]WQD41831.1 tripartite tricarboxylate transporter substrate binding protein [Comamonas testosteroni]
MKQTMPWRAIALASCLSLSAATMPLTANAQQALWPVKPLRLVVGGPAGGNADSLARLLADGMQKQLGKPVIVESKPGAAGVLAVNDLLANGKDAHTFLLIQGGIVSETPLAYKVSYQPFKDLKPLAQLSRNGLVLIANKDFPANNLQQLADYGKKQSDGLDFASYATGMRGHTSGMLLGQLLNIKMKHLGYKGSPPALSDLMGGHVPLMMDGLTTALPLIKAGKVKPLAVNYPTRMVQLPDVPTFKELGYPQLSEVSWFGVWSRPDIPADVQARVRAIALQYFKQPQVEARLRDMGMEPGTDATPEALMSELQKAFQRQQALLKSIDYQPQ